MHKSRGYKHHADSTVQCPDCGRKHRTGTVVAERPDGKIEVTFRSKQTGQWGRIVVPVEAVEWSDSHSTSTPEPEPEPTMAWVSVDDQGRLTPESTVTVGEWTWPVPERTDQAGVRHALGRIGIALRERGWRQVMTAERDRSRPGEIGIPVERVPDDG